MSIKLADTLAPMGDFPAVESDNVDITISGSPKSLQQAYEDGDLGGGGSSIQVDTIPAPSAENVGKIVQYVGATGSYEHGCFYECKDESGNYVWRNIPTVKNGVFYTSNNIIDSTLYPVGSVAVYTGEPQWGLFKGHHYEYGENKPLTTYRFDCVKNGQEVSIFLANKELKVGSALIRISDGYIVSYVSVINGNTITVQGRTYTDTFTDVVETGETEEVASYTGWIDIGGGSDGGEDNGTSIFNGTMDEWNALTTEQKKEYDNLSTPEEPTTDVATVSNPFTRDTTHTQTVSEIQAFKQGRIASFKVYVEFKNIEEGTWNDIGTVVNAIKPLGETPLIISDGRVATAMALARIYTNGKVQVWGSNSLNTLSTRLSAMYFTAN